MPSNFNTAPSAGWGHTGWEQPVTAGPAIRPIESANSGYPMPAEWGASTAPSQEANSWAPSSLEAPSDISYLGNPEPGIVEKTGNRIKEFGETFRGKVGLDLGRRALGAIMNRMPSIGAKENVQNFAQSALENPGMIGNVQQNVMSMYDDRASYIDQGKQLATGAGREIAGAGVTAAKETVMKYYGLEKDENEKLRVARKLKFGKAVVKTLFNPIGTASSVGTRAAYSARKAVKQEAVNQVRGARNNVLQFPRPHQYGESLPEASGW